jgi:hypothetical protein
VILGSNSASVETGSLGPKTGGCNYARLWDADDAQHSPNLTLHIGYSGGVSEADGTADRLPDEALLESQEVVTEHKALKG